MSDACILQLGRRVSDAQNAMESLNALRFATRIMNDILAQSATQHVSDDGVASEFCHRAVGGDCDSELLEVTATRIMDDILAQKAPEHILGDDNLWLDGFCPCG